MAHDKPAVVARAQRVTRVSSGAGGEIAAGPAAISHEYRACSRAYRIEVPAANISPLASVNIVRQLSCQGAQAPEGVLDEDY